MSKIFTKEDFKEFLDDLDNRISVDLSENEIEELTMSIAKAKDIFTEKDVLNAIEHYKRDMLRCILWKSVLRGLLLLNISDDGNEISFSPE